MTRETRRAALLIRWHDHGDQTRWQATVENAYTGETVRFVQQCELLRFLRTWVYGLTAGVMDADERPGRDEGTERTDS